MQPVDRFFKTLAHLYLVDHYKVSLIGSIVRGDVIIQRVIFHEFFIFMKIEIDVDHIGTIVIGLYARDERLQQFRLAASAHVRDDFDVGRAGYTFQLVKVSGSLDQFYRFSPR